MNDHDPSHDARLSRRQVLQFFAGTGALMVAGDSILSAQEVAAAAQGYGTDPNLTKLYKPGDVWPLTMTPAQKAATTAFADLLLPADKLGPAASAVRVPDYIDEWISAPYPSQKATRPGILRGLDWLDAESHKRFQKVFAKLSLEQQSAICDDICDHAKSKPEFRPGAGFFQSFRNLAMGAYYATPQGWEAIGYVGNIPLTSFDGPPPEVLKQLGVEQTVK